MEKKNDFNGVIPVLKPTGMTSHDVVAKIRRLIGMKRVGHTGTLDPEVAGVLPICIGKATRLSEYMMEMPKAYTGQLKLGFSTTTLDATGDKVDEKKVSHLKKEDIKTVFQNFIGEIDQVPPMFSSVKVDGQKLYTLARKGIEIERKSRKVTIYDLEIIDMNLEDPYPIINFHVVCSKGTYIRTLCYDIGQELGYPAHMSKLLRTESGSFTNEMSYTLKDIEEAINNNELNTIIVSMNDSLPNYQAVTLSDEEIEKKIFNGQKLYLQQLSSYHGMIKIVDSKGELVALYEKSEDGKIARPIKVFK